MAKKPQKRMKHVPQRTCIGCRSVLQKRDLTRLVRNSEGVAIDLTGKANGRGAYVHNIRSCWEQALKGAINHALRTELSAEDRLKLREFMELLPDEKSAQSEEMTA